MGCYLQNVLTKLLSLQKKALKICLGWFYQSRKNRILQQKTPPTNLTVFQLTNKLPVSDLYKHQSAKFVYLVVNNLSTSCFQHFFKYTSMIHRHNTRQNSNLHLNQSTSSAAILQSSVKVQKYGIQFHLIYKNLPRFIPLHISTKDS